MVPLLVVPPVIDKVPLLIFMVPLLLTVPLPPNVPAVRFAVVLLAIENSVFTLLMLCCAFSVVPLVKSRTVGIPLIAPAVVKFAAAAVCELEVPNCNVDAPVLVIPLERAPLPLMLMVPVLLDIDPAKLAVPPLFILNVPLLLEIVLNVRPPLLTLIVPVLLVIVPKLVELVVELIVLELVIPPDIDKAPPERFIVPLLLTVPVPAIDPLVFILSVVLFAIDNEVLTSLIAAPTFNVPTVTVKIGIPLIVLVTVKLVLNGMFKVAYCPTINSCPLVKGLSMLAPLPNTDILPLLVKLFGLVKGPPIEILPFALLVIGTVTAIGLLFAANIKQLLAATVILELLL